ncbi:MAG: hypothetical protein AAFQ83_05500 [Bacteroidota bacterium]
MRYSCLLLLLFLWLGCQTTTSPPNLLQGPYLNVLAKAKEKPQMLHPGIISTPHQELNGIFSPDGNYFFYSVESPDRNYSTILFSERNPDGNWTYPEIAPFSGQYSDVDPLFHPTKNRIYFCSNRPAEGSEPQNALDIWYVDWEGEDTGTPQRLPNSINTRYGDFYPSTTKNDKLYFATWDNERRTDDIFQAIPNDTGYVVTNLGPVVNSYDAEFDAFIAPDDSYLLFASFKRGGLGSSDLYISFQADTGWTAPVNLGPTINSSSREYCPVVVNDSVLLFSSYRQSESYESETFTSRNDLESRFRQIENGLGNIYFVKWDVEQYRP